MNVMKTFQTTIGAFSELAAATNTASRGSGQAASEATLRLHGLANQAMQGADQLGKVRFTGPDASAIKSAIEGIQRSSGWLTGVTRDAAFNVGRHGGASRSELLEIWTVANRGADAISAVRGVVYRS